jgi:hypothetical protein
VVIFYGVPAGAFPDLRVIIGGILIKGMLPMQRNSMF